MAHKVIKSKAPADKLTENMNFLQDMIENPEKLGAFILLGKIRHCESKPPININLLDFKVKIERKIRKINWEIYKKLGLDVVPDGRKE